MRIVLLTRYPRVDTPSWKRRLGESLLASGADLSIIYTRSALADHVRAGLQEFGLGALSRYRSARGVPPRAETSDAVPLGEWGEAQGVPIRKYREIGDPQLSAHLHESAPDLIILAGADIVPPVILGIPRLGTLNPHYGLLPRYRGMNVTEWSIYHDDPVGVTVHLVDAGIDTGDIVLREPVVVQSGDTLPAIRARQQTLAAQLLAQAVSLIGGGSARPTHQPAAAGKQYYRMHPLLREQVEAKLQRGSYRWRDRVPTLPELKSVVRGDSVRPA